jgi:hypothetical protein
MENAGDGAADTIIEPLDGVGVHEAADIFPIRMADSVVRSEGFADSEEFEDKLREVVTSYRGRLDEPERDLLSMISQHKEEFAKEIKEMAADSMTQMRAAARQVEKRVDKLIEARLHDLVLEAVREHVRSTPFEQDSVSNKQLAAAKGISLRAAKRLRRAGSNSVTP